MFSPQSGYIGQLVAQEISRQGGFEVRSDAWIAFATQVQRETGGVVTANNPLNLTDPGHGFLWRRFGQVGHRSGGSSAEWHTNFAAFDTLEGGAAAAAANYLGDYYPNVIDALRRGVSPTELAREIQRSPWDSGHYGGDDSLVAATAEAMGAAPQAAAPTPLESILRAPDVVTAAVDTVRELPGRAAARVRESVGTQLVIVLLVVLALIIIASAL